MESSSPRGAPAGRARFRLVASFTVAALVTLAATVVVARPAHAADGFVRGMAVADATTFSLSAKLGGANAGITWGASQASYREEYAAAAAKPLDLQLIRLLMGEPSRCTGSTDPVPLPDSAIPVNFVTNTLQPAAGTPVEGDADFPGFYGAPSPGKVGHGRVLVTPTPTATATTTTPTIDLAVFALVNPSTRTEAALQGEVRTASATMTAERIEFLGGMLVIDRPTWSASIRTGAVTSHEGSFTVAGGTLFGEARTAEEAMGDLKGAAQWIEWLLGYVGLGLDLPEVTIEESLVSVSPLKLHVTNSPLGRDIIAPLMSAAVGDDPSFEELLEQGLDEWAEESCDNRRFRQLAPIVVDLIKGTGTVALPMGGVTVSTDDTPPPDYGEVVPFTPPAPSNPTVDPGGPGVLGASVPFGGSGGSGRYAAPTTGTGEGSDEAPAGDGAAGEAGPEVVEFAAPTVNRSRSIAGETGGGVVWLGALLAVASAGAFASERAWRTYRLRRMTP